MISYRNKFIFIHTYKVEGTSMAQALRPYAFRNPFDRLINGLKNLWDFGINVPFYKY